MKTQVLDIKTPRLHIRNLNSSDIDDFHMYRSNPEVTKYQGFDVMDLDQSKTFIKGQQDKKFGVPGEWVQYGIALKTTGKIIGDCAIKLNLDDVRIAEVGITISHLEQNQGNGKEALYGIMSFLFDRKKIHRIKEIVDVENIASIKLLESLNFRKEGHFIENIFFNGKWGSEFQYALLKRQWDKLQT